MLLYHSDRTRVTRVTAAPAARVINAITIITVISEATPRSGSSPVRRTACAGKTSISWRATRRRVCDRFPDTDLAGTYGVAERARGIVADWCEPHAKAERGILTLSIGITAFVPSFDSAIEQHLEFADEALYEAKRHGRNQVRASRQRVGVLGAGVIAGIPTPI